jgi:3-deoxy-D-manno-octulosonic-acid transferase
MIFLLYKIYAFLSVLAYPFLIIFLKIRVKNKKEDPLRFTEKLGFYTKNRPKGQLIWLHVASVGEMNSIVKLVQQLSQKMNVLITSGTLTSSINFSQKNFKNIGEFEVFHQFAPLDSLICVRRFLSYFKPNVAGIVESEIWFNAIYETSKMCKLFSINTSFSPSSLAKWQNASNLFRWVFGRFYMIFPSSKNLALELSKAGIHNITFLGNLKYDADFHFQNEGFPQEIKAVCFASIHEGEEIHLISSLKKVLEMGFCPILIPRHIEKLPKMLYALNESGLRYTLKSKNATPEEKCIFVVDEMGKSLYYYSISSLIFMGGSLVNIGGHNIIEPAFLAKPIIIGNYYFKCKEIVEEFLLEKAVVVSNENDLPNVISALLTNPELSNEMGQNAYKILKKHQNIANDVARIIVHSSKIIIN